MAPVRLPPFGAVEGRYRAEANQLYLERYCSVPSLSVPDAFLDDRLASLSDNQSLVRIEALARENSDLDRGLTRQRADDGDGAGARRSHLLRRWNRAGARPAFAAFCDEVQKESDDADWPHALRDRLGLGHYGGRAELPVALMRYSLADVFSAQASRQLSAACALPTVLDGGMHEFFFPVPREHLYGATVHLLPGLADTLTAEIVHCRIDYQRTHLYRLGTITQPHQLTDNQLRDARDLHLLALQVDCGRADFGEPLKGRT